jgi:hypothetical protein
MLERGKRDTDFVTICHGEPWIGSIYFRFEKDSKNHHGNDEKENTDSFNEQVVAKTNRIGNRFRNMIK